MASISINTWRPPAAQIKGRNADKKRKRALWRLQTIPWASNVIFETEGFRRRKRQLVVIRGTWQCEAFVIHQRAYRGKDTPHKVRLPHKVALAMLLSVIKRKLL